MKKTGVNFTVDVMSFAVFVCLVTTGIILEIILPPGSGRLQGEGIGYLSGKRMIAMVWGMTRHEWGEIHFKIAIALIVLLALHLALHWKWIICMIRGRPEHGSGWRVILGLTGLFALLLIFLSPFLSPKIVRYRENLLKNTGAAENIQIKGFMTLEEIEKKSGVKHAILLQTLSLPPDTSPKERLGKLKQVYGFNMQEVKESIRKQMSQKNENSDIQHQ